MKKYIEKKVSEVEKIQGFNLVESALFRENNLTDLNDIYKNFPDLRTKSWLTKFMQEMSKIGNSEKFVSFLEAHKNKNYCVIGDYDADGIMATTIMKLALDTFGVKKCEFIIPDRINDGYGIKEKHVDRALEMGTEVIVTVDNGITANSAIEYAKSKGLLVIVTDHHIPDKNNLPGADILINPHLTNEVQEDICGAFVAFKLALALLNLSNKEHEYVLKDMSLFAAVATVSDVMPLLNENRLLVKYVLDNVNFVKEKNLWVGRTLKFVSGFSNGRLIKDKEVNITEDTIGFYIGPTINASGRVNGETENIVRDIIASVEYAKFINGYKEINIERRKKTQEIFKEHIHNHDEPVGFLIIDSKKYEYPIGGLIGLVANRIADQEGKPAFVGTEKDGKISFSCRSVPGYSLYEALERFHKKHPNTSVQGGGHDGAIGIRTANDDEIKLLKEHFYQDYLENRKDTEEVLYVYEPSLMNEIFESHRKLSPFGKNFNRLKFVYEGKVENVDTEQYLVQVGEVVFKAYSKAAVEQKLNSRVRVIFSASLDNKVYDDYKIEEITVIGE
jgi:single-stranded-DNA-specific exonuclease